MPTVKKICTVCKIEKDASCFHKNNGQKSGLYPSCKECRKPVLKRYAQSERGRQSQRNGVAKWRKNNKNEARKRAKIYADRRKKLRKTFDKFRNQKEIKGLSDYYIKTQLRNQGCPNNIIDKELIEIKRMLLRIKRLFRSNKNDK